MQPHLLSPLTNYQNQRQPRSQGLFPCLGAGPPSQGKGPGNEVESAVHVVTYLVGFLINI